MPPKRNNSPAAAVALVEVYEHVEEIVMVTIQMREHMQTMGGQTATVVFAEVIASVIWMIAIW